MSTKAVRDSGIRKLRRWKTVKTPDQAYRTAGEGVIFMHSEYGKCISLMYRALPREIFWYCAVGDKEPLLKEFISDSAPMRMKVLS